VTVKGNGRLSATEYAELVGRVNDAVAAAVPAGASLLVVSKGDVAMLEMPGLKAAHFPQDGAGGYAGHYPRDSAAAKAQLEALRHRGAEYFVLPATARWWLDFYADFAGYLASDGELVADVADTCMVWRLARLGDETAGAPPPARPQASIDQLRDFLENLTSTDTGLAVLERNRDIAAGLAPLSAVPVTADDMAWEDGEELLARLGWLSEAGTDYLVVPRSSDEWLDRHSEVLQAIEARCRKVADQRHLCRVYELSPLRERSA
jgi:hypothetical protein